MQTHLKHTRVVVLFWLLVPLISTAAEIRSPGMLEFVRGRSSRLSTQVPRKVLAFYYTWYGTPQRHGRWVHWGNVDPAGHEISESTHYPALGAYDSYDPAIIDQHIDMAQESGVDGFICTWWGRGTFDDGALREVLRRAERKQFSDHDLLGNRTWRRAGPGRSCGGRSGLRTQELRLTSRRF